MAVVKGKGTVLELSIAGPFVAIAQLKEVAGPSLEVRTVEGTDLSETAASFCATIKDAGELTGKLNFDPVAVTHQALTDLWVTPTDGESWKLIFADAANTEWPFTAILTGFQPTGMTPEGILEADFTLKLTGDVVLPT